MTAVSKLDFEKAFSGDALDGAKVFGDGETVEAPIEGALFGKGDEARVIIDHRFGGGEMVVLEALFKSRKILVEPDLLKIDNVGI